MARYLLVPTVLIDASKDLEPATSWLTRALSGTDEIGTSAVTMAEFFAGLRPEEREGRFPFLDLIRCWEVTCEVARQAGIYRYTYARRGVTISTTDALIAAVAIDVGAIIVTNNARHFPLPEAQVPRVGA